MEPASPANMPENSMVRMMVRFTLIPAYLAASGFKPTVRISNPKVVFHNSHQMKIATRTAIKKPTGSPATAG